VPAGDVGVGGKAAVEVNSGSGWKEEEEKSEPMQVLKVEGLEERRPIV
jgi:hypothetical protein